MTTREIEDVLRDLAVYMACGRANDARWLLEGLIYDLAHDHAEEDAWHNHPTLEDYPNGTH